MILVSVDLEKIVSEALRRAWNDEMNRVPGASQCDYVVADVTAALHLQEVDVVAVATEPDIDEAPSLPTAAQIADAKLMEAEKRVGA